MFRPQSIQRDYSLVSEYDGALDLPVIPDPSDEPEAIEARKKAIEERAHKLKVIRERSEWPTLVKPGHSATIFHFRHIPGSALDWWEGQRAKLGDVQLQALLFRLALLRIENFGEDGDLEFEEISGERILSVASLNKIYALDGDPMGVGRKVVHEFSQAVFAKTFRGVSPLS